MDVDQNYQAGKAFSFKLKIKSIGIRLQPKMADA